MRNQLFIIAQSLQQPRVIKRIYQNAQRYERVYVFGFKRNFYDVDNISLLADCPNVEIHVLGTIANRSFVKRTFLFLKLIFLVNFTNPIKEKQVYAFGLDSRFISMFFLNAVISYEISDIMWLYLDGLKMKILRRLDFFLAKKSVVTYFTSQGFYEQHFNFLPQEKVEIVENKFESYGKVFPLSFLKTDKIRVAYVGAFRYPSIISALLSVFKRNPDMELNFYGDGFGRIIDEIKEASQLYSNISFSGAFKNPVDLEGIYAENNVNFVAYDNRLGNERVAMPNKFYESGFFNIPIVCSVNTHVGERALKLGMGWTINPDEASIESFLKSLELTDIVSCHERIKRLDKGLFSV